ncbi:MAG TPA: SRPBCC family protein [Methylophilaceae bacterium]|nr:SRPBCC family protein [Methylophilaceae bacterium]
MSIVEKSIEVDVPCSVAYNQWTQFEDFPKFMEGIEEVTQIDDTHLHWRAEIAGVDKEWNAEITEQIPDTRIAWRSTSGAVNSGVVTFDEISENSTLVTVQMQYEPEGAVENVGDALGVFSSRVEGDLERFKEFLEARGRETGAWRGSVESGQRSS